MLQPKAGASQDGEDQTCNHTGRRQRSRPSASAATLPCATMTSFLRLRLSTCSEVLMKLHHGLELLLLLSMLGCSHRVPSAALINKDASLAGDLPFDPLQWKVICSSVSRRDVTMATLYGNDVAVRRAREN